MNIGKILNRTTNELRRAGIETSDLDARILLSEALKKGTTYIYSHPEALITNSDYQKFRRFIRRRKKGEPVAYIIGEKDFYGYTFKVNKNVLIPRPETELIVDEALKYIRSHCEESSTKQSDRLPQPFKRLRNDRINIIDIGTGSGCIIISLMKEIQKLKIVPQRGIPLRGKNCKLKIEYHASDIDNKALRVAKINAKSMNVYDDIIFYKSNLLANPRIPNKLDIITANLPYVPKNNLSLNTRNSINYEPRDAIFADDNGTQIIKQLIDQARNRLNKNGLVLVEVDPRNARVLKDLAKKVFQESKTELLRDLAHNYRIIKILT